MAEDKKLTPEAKKEKELKAKAEKALLEKRDSISKRMEELFGEAKEAGIMIRPAITKQETVVNGNLYVTCRPHMIVEPMTPNELKMIEDEKVKQMVDEPKKEAKK